MHPIMFHWHLLILYIELFKNHGSNAIGGEDFIK